MAAIKEEESVLDIEEDHTVIIEVGPSRKPFHTHLNLLIRSSKFFEAAFRVDGNGDGVFKEAIEKRVDLPTVKPETYRYFSHWLYSGHVPPFSTASSEDYELAFKKFVDLYVFGDTYDIMGLCYSACVAIMDLLIPDDQYTRNQEEEKLPSIGTFARAWERTAKDSPLRTILLSRAMLSIKPEWFDDEKNEEALERCPDFTFQLLKEESRRGRFHQNPAVVKCTLRDTLAEKFKGSSMMSFKSHVCFFTQSK